jgi:hypothetical protein
VSGLLNMVLMAVLRMLLLLLLSTAGLLQLL